MAKYIGYSSRWGAEIAEMPEKVEIATNMLFIYLARPKFLSIKQDKEFNLDDSF